MTGKTKAAKPFNQRTFELMEGRSAVLTEVDADRPWEVEYCQNEGDVASRLWVRYFSSRGMACASIMDFGVTGDVGGAPTPNFKAVDDGFDSIPDECKLTHQQSEMSQRRADRGFSVRGSSPVGYRPRRRAPRARDRVLYAAPGIVTVACLSAIIGVSIALLGAALNWW